jgi:hypothetical protein
MYDKTINYINQNINGFIMEKLSIVNWQEFFIRNPLPYKLRDFIFEAAKIGAEVEINDSEGHRTLLIRIGLTRKNGKTKICDATRKKKTFV